MTFDLTVINDTYTCTLPHCRIVCYCIVMSPGAGCYGASTCGMSHRPLGWTLLLLSRGGIETRRHPRSLSYPHTPFVTP